MESGRLQMMYALDKETWIEIHVNCLHFLFIFLQMETGYFKGPESESQDLTQQDHVIEVRNQKR